MKTKSSLIVFAIVTISLCGSVARATVWGSGNLLPANLGGMEDGSMWVWRTDGKAVQSNVAAHTGTYSAKITNTGASNLTVYAQPTATFSTVLNREHYYNVWTQQGGSLGSGYMRGVMYWNGTLQNMFTSPLGATTTTGFSQKGTSFRPTGTGVYNDFKIGVNAKTETGTAYFDDLSLFREIAAPEVSSDSHLGVDLQVGQSQTVTISNVGGTHTEGGYVFNVYFDPDIQIVTDNGNISNISWISDTKVSFDIIANQAGNANLTFTNPYGNQSSDYTLSVVPEPATMVILGLGSLVVIRRKYR